MSNPLDQRDEEIAKLKHEIRRLNAQLNDVTKERDDLRARQPFASGGIGEAYVAEQIDGSLTITNRRWDVVTRAGLRLEVKLSKIRPHKHSNSNGWAWADIFGKDGLKEFDRLILLGPPDPILHVWLKDQFVIFDIPYQAARALFPNPNFVGVTTNSAKARDVGRTLFRNYKITAKELVLRYGPTSPSS